MIFKGYRIGSDRDRMLPLATGTKRKRSPIHPGEALREIIEATGLSANALALALRLPTNRITKILRGERGITADTAMRLARYFGKFAKSAYSADRRRCG